MMEIILQNPQTLDVSSSPDKPNFWKWPIKQKNVNSCIVSLNACETKQHDLVCKQASHIATN